MCGSPPVRLSTSVAVRGSLTWDHESRTDSLTIGTTPESILAMVNSEKLSQMFVWAKLKQLLCFYTFSQTLFWPCLTWGLLAGIKVLSIWVKTFNNELRVLRSELSEENINLQPKISNMTHSWLCNPLSFLKSRFTSGNWKQCLPVRKYFLLCLLWHFY